MKTTLSVLCFLIQASACLSARTWTNAEGRTIEAEFVSSDGRTVELDMKGKVVKYQLSKLSEADNEFVRVALDKANAEKPEVKTGVSAGVRIDTRLFPDVDDYWKESVRKACRKAFESGKEYPNSNKGTYEDWVARDEAKDICNFLVPSNYDGSKAFGLLLVISPGGSGAIPGQWMEVLEKMEFIAVGADNCGNDQPMMRRVQRSMDAFATAKKLYRIDTSRCVVTGLSGGGHMAMLTGALFPEHFCGAISHAAQSYLARDNSGGHFPGLELGDFKRGPRGKMRWMVVSGDKDQNYKIIQETSASWEKARLSYRFLDVPGMGHAYADAGPMRECLEWVSPRKE